jgi:16S rRNA processing protein RimM
VELIFDDDRVLEPGCKLELLLGVSRRTVEVEHFRRQHGRFVVKLAGVDSIEQAEKIIGAELKIPESALPAPLEGSFYTFQLRGCKVYADGDDIGEVTDIIDSGGTQTLQVGVGKDETLIPFAESIVKKIDVAARRIEVELPEGLRELNK